MSNVKYPNVTVKLVGQDGNAFYVLGKVASSLKAVGVSKKDIDEFYTEATKDDYDHLLQTVMKYVIVE